MADWVTISSLSTAGGTLVLAGATFASVRSANRAARVAERSLLAGLLVALEAAARVALLLRRAQLLDALSPSSQHGRVIPLRGYTTPLPGAFV